jgi:hypothetical protein
MRIFRIAGLDAQEQQNTSGNRPARQRLLNKPKPSDQCDRPSRVAPRDFSANFGTIGAAM